MGISDEERKRRRWRNESLVLARACKTLGESYRRLTPHAPLTDEELKELGNKPPK